MKPLSCVHSLLHLSNENNSIKPFYKVRNPTVFEQWQCKCYAWHKYKPYIITGYFLYHDNILILDMSHGTVMVSHKNTIVLWFIPLYSHDIPRYVRVYQGTSSKSTILDMYYGTLTYTMVFMWHSWVFPNIPWYMSKKKQKCKNSTFLDMYSEDITGK